MTNNPCERNFSFKLFLPIIIGGAEYQSKQSRAEAGVQQSTPESTLSTGVNSGKYSEYRSRLRQVLRVQELTPARVCQLQLQTEQSRSHFFNQTGAGLKVSRAETGAGLKVSRAETGAGLKVSRAETGAGLKVSRAETGAGLEVSRAETGAGLEVSRAETGAGLEVSRAETGAGLEVSRVETGAGVKMARADIFQARTARGPV